MTTGRMMLVFALLAVLGIPFAMRPQAAKRDANARVLVAVTPHVPQICREFGEAFAAWHLEQYGQPARIDWRSPGGTAEIMKQLEAQYLAAAKRGDVDFSNPKIPVVAQGAISADIMFGGGSYEHGRLKTGVKIRAEGEEKSADGKPVERALPLSTPAGFTQDQLDSWFGENRIGAGKLYDPEQFWIGTALSGFGIVFNRPLLMELGIDHDPTSFSDLADPKLLGMVALADPRQSGSVTTTFEAILNFHGWEKGWRLLREMTANTRSFTNSSPKTPLDVSQGEAAAGLTIDFYGRGQAQAIAIPGEPPASNRVGYIDPMGETFIDADPVSILRGGPDPELAARFVEFTLSDRAQALWQFRTPSHDPDKTRPRLRSGETLGPQWTELRRMPIRREFYDRFRDRMIDRPDPFAVASNVKSLGWRSSIGLMMGAFAVDVATEQRAAWRMLIQARADARFPREALAEMEVRFYDWPKTKVGEKELEFIPENYSVIRESWRPPGAIREAEVKYTEFFRKNYRRIIQLGEQNMSKEK